MASCYHIGCKFQVIIICSLINQVMSSWRAPWTGVSKYRCACVYLCMKGCTCRYVHLCMHVCAYVSTSCILSMQANRLTNSKGLINTCLRNDLWLLIHSYSICSDLQIIRRNVLNETIGTSTNLDTIFCSRASEEREYKSGGWMKPNLSPRCVSLPFQFLRNRVPGTPRKSLALE